MRRPTSLFQGRIRPHLIGLLGVALVASGVATASPASAAVKSPTALAVKLPNSSTPVLTWKRARGATNYQVQVDNDGSFASAEVNENTKNERYVPSRNLSRGVQHWRVRAEKAGAFSSWSTGTFTVSAVGIPVGTAPADGAVLPQPDEPPLLRWQTSRGAVSYTVEVDGDSDFIGAKSYTTKTTSLALPEALPAGDYFWRVTASLEGGFNSLSSSPKSFILGALPSPKLTFPLDDINQSVKDVVFDWEPVPGALTYDLQVATDSTFNNFAYKADNLYGSRYSPPTTLYNDQFWWRVRAVDLAGQSTAWATARFSFKRQWLDTPVPQHPTGARTVPDSDVPASNGDRHFYQWSPVQHASRYRFEVAMDVNFSVQVRTCTTAATTYAPRSDTDCTFPDGTVHYWRVRPEDLPYADGLPGIFTTAQKVKFGTPPPVTAPPAADFPTVTGLKVAMTGLGAAGGTNTGCNAVVCQNLSTTPVLTWNRMPGITYYKIQIAIDENFTTSPVRTAIVTDNNFLALREGDERSALAESEAGQPYFWYVIPCTSSGCGLSPVSQFPALPGAHSFQKISPPITGLVSSDPSGSDISFSWQDYFVTNINTPSHGETGQQAARTYRIQVDNEPSFSEPLLDSAVVDQATYTAGDRLYPEGRIYWRVQAVDNQDNGLTWSPPAELIKASPTVTLRSPVSGAPVSGAAPFEWAPQAYARAYEVEVYRDNDTAFSPVNRVVSARVANPAFTPSEPFPASAAAYTWRVRRIDSRNNPGPWQSGSFVSLGSAPELLAPRANLWQSATSSYFEWSDVPGAVSYQLSLRAGTNNQVTTTVGTAFAPSELASGSYTWQVTALDASGKALGSSPSRAFRVDAEAPRVMKVGPNKMKAKSTIKVTLSEAVKGVNKKTVVLKRANRKGKFKVKVKVKVKVKKRGRVVLIDPKGRLKKGTYQIRFTNKRIRDEAGNQLVDVTAAVPGL